MLRFFAEMPLNANLFPLESSIQKHVGSRSAAPVGGAEGQSPPQKKNWRKKNVDKIFFVTTIISHSICKEMEYKFSQWSEIRFYYAHGEIDPESC